MWIACGKLLALVFWLLFFMKEPNFVYLPGKVLGLWIIS